MSSHSSGPRLILGSTSPRRRELLGLVADFDVRSPNIVEVPKAGESPDAYVRRNAQEKGEAVLAGLTLGDYPQGVIVISADTIVVLGQQILEKPADVSEAKRMLTTLSGKTHRVISGVYICAQGTKHDAVRQFICQTEVMIKALSPREIDAYIASGEPFDKAGGYAAQGRGSYFVKAIVGSYSNVVGLPMAELVQVLEGDFGLPLWIKN